MSTDLGGGVSGHLGWVLTPAGYTNIYHAPYVRPLYPGALNIPLGTTQQQSTQLRDEFKEDIWLYRKAK